MSRDGAIARENWDAGVRAGARQKRVQCWSCAELREAMEFVRTAMEDMAEDARANGAAPKALKIERRLAILEAAVLKDEDE